MDQMLELSFPLRAFYYGGCLTMRAIEPFRAGYHVTFEGEITVKQMANAQRQAASRVRGINQRGDLVCLGDATLNLPA